MSAEAPTRIDDPYVGPVSFRSGDRLYGRDREREHLQNLLIAERIVLLYSPSGAGKTSLIEAALIPALRAAEFEVLPTIRVTHTLPPEPGMPVARNRYVLSVLLSLEEGVPREKQRSVGELASMTLSEYLSAHADRDDKPGNEVLVFDQFEEVLTADPTDEPAKHAFFKELGEMLRDRSHWALFSMREDFLAALDPYLRYVPTRLRTTVRLDLLSVPKALEAIRRPAQQVGVDFTEEAARQLVDDLRTVRVQGPSGIAEVLGSTVEPVQLQVACHLLWSMLPPDSTEITRTDVDALGQVDRALGDYYSERVRTAAERTGVPEGVIRDWFEEHLITPQGLRSQVLQGPEAPAESGHRLLNELLDAHLVRAETRRQATWYELAHDRLIEPVRKNNAAWRDKHLSSMERAAVLWEHESRPDRLLLQGPELTAAEQDEAVRVGDLPTRQAAFLEASRRAHERVARERRSARLLRVAAISATVLAVTSVIGASLFWLATKNAEDQKKNAEDQKAITSVFLDAQRSLDVDQDLGVALAAEGADHYGAAPRTEQVRDVLYQAAVSPVSLVLRGQQGPSNSAVISEDASVVVVAGPEDIRIWDRETGEPRARLQLEDGEVVYSTDVTDDGSTVIAGMENGTLLVWDIDSNEPHRWPEGSGFVWTTALSPVGGRFASVGRGTQVQVWNLDGTLELAVEDAESAYTNSVAFSADGRLLATVGDKAEVVLWDAVSGEERARLPLPEVAWNVVFGADGRTLATVTASAVTVWDLERWEHKYPPLLAAPKSFRNLEEDLSQALSVDPFGRVSVYDMQTGGEIASSSVPGASIWGAGFDAEPGRVLVLGNDVDPAFWDLRPAAAHEYMTAAAAAGGRIFSAWSDGTLWESSSLTPDRGERLLPGIRTDNVSELSVDSEGGRMAAVVGGQVGGQVQVWNTTTDAKPLVLEPMSQYEGFVDVDLTPDGTLVVTGDALGGVRLWDAVTGELMSDVLYAPNPYRAVTELQVSPDGMRVLAALAPSPPESDGAARLEPVALVASLHGGEPAKALMLPAEDEAHVVTAAAYGPDGTSVVLGTRDGAITRLDSRTGDLLWSDVRATHRGEVQDVAIDETDGSILSMGADDRVLILDPSDGAEIGWAATGSLPRAAILAADGDELVLATKDSGTVVVPLNVGDLLEVVRSKIIYDLSREDCVSNGFKPDC